MPRLVVLLAFLIGVAITTSAGFTAHAQRRTPTPNPPSTPTVTPTVKSFPSTVTVVERDGTLYWSDVWDDEARYEVHISACHRSFHYVVAADTASFVLPPEYLEARTSCDGCSRNQQWNITAFDAEGNPVGSGFGGDPPNVCAPRPTATPIVVSMPTTGSPGGSASGEDWRVALLSGGIASLGAGITVLVWVYNKRQWHRAWRRSNFATKAQRRHSR